jgi:uncharacterized protein (TIRG00374 family)
MPDEFSPRHLRTRLLQLALLVLVVVAIIWATPGLGSLRDELKDAAGGWFLLAVAFELGSTLSYVVVFRAVFCPRMSWRMSYQIGMAEQAANSLLPAGGAGGLALGAWALRRSGISAEHIARRTVAFFLVTSLANVGTLIVCALLFLVGVLHHDAAPIVTYVFAGVAVVVILIALGLPLMTKRSRARRAGRPAPTGKLRKLAFATIDALGDGVQDALSLLRQRQLGVLLGAFGYMAFDIAVLGACFRAFGHVPPVGVLAVAYIIGQIGGLIPIPGGIGGTEGGLIGVFVLYNTPLALTTAAVLIYRAIQLWLPALLGSVAFVQLRNALQRENETETMCAPLADQIEPVRLPVPAS